MQNLSIYSVTLLLTEGQHSCVKVAQQLNLGSHDFLTRSLKKNAFSACDDWTKLLHNGYIVFDDIVIDKRFSKNIEGVSFAYSSSDKKVIPGLSVILVLWVTAQQVFVLDVLIWQKGGTSKNELIQGSRKKVYESKLRPTSVYFDVWYTSYKTLNQLNSYG